MALESVFAIAPPLIGVGNKDTQIGEKESEQECSDTGQATDLEEGEILDSEGEANSSHSNEKTPMKVEAEKDTAISEENVHEDISAEEKKKKKKKKRKSSSLSQAHDEVQIKKKKANYVDHDKVDNDDPDWFRSFNTSHYSSRERPIDYSRELAEYRGGSPVNSPGPYDTPIQSPDCRRSRSPYTSTSYGEDDDVDESELRKKKGRSSRSHLKMSRKQSSARGVKKKRSSEKRRGNISLRGRRKEQRQTQRTKCRYYAEGKCKKGNDCPFLHSISLSQKRKRELCKFYLGGYCAKGESCLYMHKEFPCKFYHTGAKCYSDESCRFSHDRLTEEKRRLLDDYLEFCKQEDRNGSDSDDLKMSPSKQQKRPSLLGSPPRHIKESAETFRWQQGILQLQQKNNGHGLFEIKHQIIANQQSFHNSSLLPRPNFYADTFKSPSKSPHKHSGSSFPNSSIEEEENLTNSFRPHVNEEIVPMEDEMEEHFNREELQMSLVSEEMIPQLEDCDTKPTDSDKKGEEIANTDAANVLPIDIDSISAPVPASAEELNPLSSVEQCFQTNQSQESWDSQSPPTPDGTNININSTPIPPPPVPVHLPKKQRELFLRIQQHQKEAVSGESGTDGAETSDHESRVEDDIQEIVEETENKERWDSSSDDDTEDQSLTSVLKKLQQMPAPANTKPATSPSIPQLNIAQILGLNSIQQNTTNSASCSFFSNQQTDFWKNILKGTAPPPSTKPQVPFILPRSKESHNSKENVNIDGKAQVSSAADIPNPNTRQLANDRTGASRDPRLQNRDPRFGASRDSRLPVSNSVNDIPTSFPVEPKSTTQDKLWDLHSVLHNKPAVVVEGGKGIGNMPYKLRSLIVPQLNYAQYVTASYSDPKLGNDPRLKKRIDQQKSTSLEQTPAAPLNSVSNNHLNNSSSAVTTPVTTNNLQHVVDVNLPVPPKVNDPRLSKLTDPRLARQQGNLTPPHPVSPMDINWISASLPVASPSPVITSVPPPPLSVITSVPPPMITSIPPPPLPATHLPRAITDPRLVRLHNPVDPRRARRSVDQTSTPVEQNHNLKNRTITTNNAQGTLSSTPLPSLRDNSYSKKLDRSTFPSNQTNSSSENNVTSEVSDSTDSLSKDSEKKTNSTAYDRKSSMVYASPLNAYNESTSTTSGYGNYNRRPKQRRPTSSAPSIPELAPPAPSLTDSRLPSSQELPNVLSVPFTTSTETTPSLEGTVDATASLKDMFKTIDPTASPFC